MARLARNFGGVVAATPCLLLAACIVGQPAAPSAAPAPGDPIGERVAGDAGLAASLAACQRRETSRAESDKRSRATRITVPFPAGGDAILTDVELEGPAGRVTLPYLFDAGASFTTLHSKTAARLGLPIPDDAPTVRFMTASGVRDSRMVYLPALRLGGVELRGLLVSVCDECAVKNSQGLLGLNVLREFLVEMDYQAERMHLQPRARTGRANRAYDINPAVRIEVEGSPEVWPGRIRWMLQVTNRSTVAIEGVVPEVQFSDGQRMTGVPIAHIAPGATGRSLVDATMDPHKGGPPAFTLSLAEASW